MVGLTDLGPLTEVITVRGKPLPVQGIPAEDWFKIFTKFPTIAALLDREEVKVTPALVQDLAKVGPDALGVILSFICGGGDDPKQVAYARRLGVGDQLKILHKGFKLTFWDGTRPFVEQLKELTNAIKATGEQGDLQGSPISGNNSQESDRDPPIDEMRFTASEGQSPGSLSASLVGEVRQPAGSLHRAS